MPPKQPMPWQHRVLRMCPLLVGLLWIAGIAHFRDLHMTPVEWAVVAAAGIAMQILTRRLSRPRPLPQLPVNTRPGPLAAIAAAIVALMAAVLGGAAEAIVQQEVPSEVPWGLRTTWHGACAFAASYCAFLERLLRSLAA